ncbi:MAG: hypothetical protein J5543_06350 [Bacteroidales bacterium]|nr:hypothetical protein [Bacteroidales bacterium]
MRIFLNILLLFILNMGLLHAEEAQQETPVITKALRDTIQERLKLARRYSTNVRTTNIKLARNHINRVLYLSDSLHILNADYFAAAGDVEDMAFNFERNKPASGGKMDETTALAAAKQCYQYYQKAYDLYQADEKGYGKNGLKQQSRLSQTAMQYYLLTNGFQVNAGQSFKKGDLVTTLDEFRMTFDGSRSSFLNSAYQSDAKRFSGFETFLADSTQNRALYNCATVSSALGRLDESLVYYDSLKVRGYEPEKVFRNTIAIYASRKDTIMLITELISAIETLPRDTWFQRNLLQIYLDRQNWTDAEKIADRCISVDSTDAQTICVRGQLYEIRGDVERAMTHYLRSYDLDSTQANVCSYIGRIHYNRAVTLKTRLYDQRRFKQIDRELQPIYNEALPWYERAYQYDTMHQDKTIPVAIREILYSRFTQDRCPNRAELIDQYNEVSRAYGLAEFGQ